MKYRFTCGNETSTKALKSSKRLLPGLKLVTKLANIIIENVFGEGYIWKTSNFVVELANVNY